MLYDQKSVKKFTSASKDFLFEEKLTLKAMIIPDTKHEGFVMLLLTTKQSAIYCASTREFYGNKLHMAERNACK